VEVVVLRGARRRQWVQECVVQDHRSSLDPPTSSGVGLGIVWRMEWGIR